MRKGQELCFCRVRGQEPVCITAASPTGMIKQFLRDVDWGEVDYLIVDTPPGTSDEHLSVVQYLATAHIDGVVIITTPQVSEGRAERGPHCSTLRGLFSPTAQGPGPPNTLAGIRRNLMFVFSSAVVGGQGGMRWLGWGLARAGVEGGLAQGWRWREDGCFIRNVS